MTDSRKLHYLITEFFYPARNFGVIMHRIFIILVLSIGFFIPGLGAMEAPLPRHPTPSPDGSLIAFDWQGDVWIISSQGGRPTRMTANPAHDQGPVWSRDSHWLAFASNRFGSFDVFVMPSDGSAAPRRLSFADRQDFPVDFNPDGRHILFNSGRGNSVRWMPALWSVPVNGGTPALAQDALGEQGRYSPSGDALLFVRGATKWTRHGYRGTASRTPWLRDPEGDYHQLSDFDGDEDHPGWIDDHSIILLSSRSERKNVFRMNLISGEVQQLTHHEGSDVRSPAISADGHLLAYEFEDHIQILDLQSGERRQLQIDLPADFLKAPVLRQTLHRDARDLVISADASLAAFIVAGDLYISEITSKEDQEIAAPLTVRLTDTAAEESHPRFSPDGNTILYSSDEGGSMSLWLIHPEDKKTGWIQSYKFPRAPLFASTAEESSAEYSPNGSQIAFIQGKGNLMICDADGSNSRELFHHWETVDFSFSPDGRYIAYSTVDPHYNSEIWIIPSEGGEPYNLSRHPDDDLEPSWSPDGRRLLWTSKRHRDGMDVWGVWLRREDALRQPADWLRLFKEGAKEPEKETDNSDGTEEKATTKELPKVQIDFDDLWRRVERLSSISGDESHPMATPDGRSILYCAPGEDGKVDLFSARFDGRKQKRLSKGGENPRDLHLGPKGKTIYFLNKDGLIKRVDLTGKAGAPIPFSARSTVDRQARREEVFSQVWKALNEWFYDPDFHGVDWESKKEIYRPWALEATDVLDFADVLNLMLGELNASHMGYYPPHKKGGEKTGWIGVDFEPESGGPGLLVRAVVPQGPADAPGVALRAGERLLSIGRDTIEAQSNIYEILVDTVGRKTPVEILTPSGDTRQALIIPQAWAKESEERYGRWVRQRQKLTNQYSEGRLGYLHIHSMDIPSFETFERDLQAAAQGRDGLIIDVRSNGGGWTTDYLLAVLMVQRHAYTIPRDDDSGIRAYPQSRLPLAAWTRPAVTLCNEDSYSNAEIFSHAFKTLHRGLLVGNTTFGAVISTSGQDLPDGGFVRTPMRGWYVAGSGMNMENNGAQPNILVVQPPKEDMSSDSDTQLRRAVDALLKEIPTDPRSKAW